MWLVLGSRTLAKPVPGGREVYRPCSECGRASRFVECEVKDEFRAFFLKLGSITARRLVCLECGEDVALDAPQPTAMTEAPATPEPEAATSDASAKASLLEALKAKTKTSES